MTLKEESNEAKLKETLLFYGITLEEYFAGCSVTDKEFYTRYGNTNL